MRIVALSDQHGHLVDVPPCDLLIVAGDQARDYPENANERRTLGPDVEAQAKWIREEWIPWALRQPAKRVVVTGGNHDYWAVDWHKRFGAKFSIWKGHRLSGRSQDWRIKFVADELVDVDGLRVWLTPWTCQYRDWAFFASDHALRLRYEAIPEGIDVLVSHQPPLGYCDEAGVTVDGTRTRIHTGSVSLLDAIDRVKPRVVICGHIHAGERHSKIGDTDVYNVSLLDDGYRLIRQPTVFELPCQQAIVL